MVPTPTPAPPMPMHAMPAPIYLAAIGSMMKLLLVWLVRKRPSVAARVKSIVEVDAGEDGEDVGLQKRDQQLERGQRHCQGERQGRAEPTGYPKPAQHRDEGGEHLEGDMTGQHIRKQAYAVRHRANQERKHFEQDD